MSPRRRLLATAEQQEEVLRRRDAGESLREIAAAVFGSERLKDRVARILRQPEEQLQSEVAELVGAEEGALETRLKALAGELTDEERVRRTRRLLELQRQRFEERLAKGEPTRASELLAMERLDMLLDSREEFFRLREMTRG